MVAFDLRGERIGTIRIVPLGHGLTLTEQLLDQLGPEAANPAPACCEWEVGRLVLSPDYRSDVDALRHCLHLALVHAFSQARVDALYATCTHALSRLYRRFGFAVVAREVPLLGTEKVYTVIRGESHDVATALGQPGAAQRTH